MKNKIVVAISVLIFALVVILAGITSDWGTSLLSDTFGDWFNFSKKNN